MKAKTSEGAFFMPDQEIEKKEDIISANGDIDSQETSEWLEALDDVVEHRGAPRANFLLARLLQHAYSRGMQLPFFPNTPYINTIPVEDQPAYPGDRTIERRIKSIIRWNAMALVVRGNKKFPGIGGHISTYASAATLYEVGFNHFFRAKGDNFQGDLVYMQGHASPGIYARAFLESSPLVNAGFLGISHRIHGAVPHLRDLPGAVCPLPARPRH
jgi:pyruvate dehydrogenase E1 component